MLYQEYAHPVYAQLHGEFAPFLSGLDLLLTHGDEALAILRSRRLLVAAAARRGSEPANEPRDGAFPMNVLAIGAHPDDIEYGCGGMLTKYAQRGHDVYLWVASDGALGGDAERAAPGADTTRRSIIGAREVFWGDYPDTEIPLNRELIVRHRVGDQARSSRG